METDSMLSPMPKWSILPSPQLKVELDEENGSEIIYCKDEKVVDLYFNIDNKLDNDAIEPCAIKKEPVDINEAVAEEFNYNPVKSEIIDPEDVYLIKYEEDNEDMLNSEKNYDSQNLFMQPETIRQEEVYLKIKIEEMEKLNKRTRKTGNQLVLRKCPECPYSTFRSSHFKSHAIKHKKSDEIDWYICHNCSYKTSRKENLRRHIVVHHRNNSILKCSKCSFECLRPSDLKRHQIEHKTNIQWLHCSECSFKTHLQSSFRRHSVTHRSDGFRCTNCSYQTANKDLLAKHQAKHESMDKFHSCPLCPFKTYYKCVLRKHCRRRHNCNPSNPKQIEIFKCTECSYENGCKITLKRHQLTHDKSSWYQCLECAYKTHHKSDLKKHQVRHQGENAEGWHRCLECPYKTTRKHDLRKHVVSHESALLNGLIPPSEAAKRQTAPSARKEIQRLPIL